MPQTTDHKSPRKAVIAILASVAALSLGDALIKATSLSVPLWQIYILRSAIVVPILWWLARSRGRKRPGSVLWVAVRSALLVAMWLSYYSALPLMPLSLAAAAYYTSPILIIVLTACLSHRWPSSRTLFAIILGFTGVVLILRPDTSGFEFATMLPVLAAFLYACAMVLTARKCRNDDPFVLALALNIAFIAAGALLALFSGQQGSFVLGTWQSVGPEMIAIMSALALVILVGSVGAAIAYQQGPPAMIAAFDYSYLLFSLVWGVLFFGEWPAALAVLGIAMIAAAGLMSLLHPPPADRRKETSP
ncbi:DMT family transporter [Tateyamaria omphalii]|uniref:DMT family transporter n=1 Tax=Tateyamaria omphalii TaxID=299262 RepID=UPI001C996B04|nr:DMT family transporter [Tateyamaria omphalii]MBY5931510.1 DMT family transporter [Tateyamaria omphalii]